MRLHKLLPILEWLPKYTVHSLKGDLSAGLTVGVMLIPQGMAYAYLAGLPPEYGLYAALVPQIVYAFLGTSRQLAVGPVAMDSLLVGAGIVLLAQVGTEEYLSLAISLALMMGVIQFLFGILRLGFLVNFLSRPVISGFTSGVALIIAFSQLQHIIRVDLEQSSQLHSLILELSTRLQEVHLPTLALGLGGIGIIYAVKYINRRFKLMIPGPLVLVSAGILIVAGFKLDQIGINIVKEIPHGLPSFEIHFLRQEQYIALVPLAFTLAFIAYLEAISISKALQSQTKDYDMDANQELIALGAANILGSFFQSYPTTGGLSRSAVNAQAGAKTSLSGWFSAALIMLTLLFLTPLFYYLPQAILASIIMVAVSSLIDIQYPQYLWKNKRDEFWMLAVTFIVTSVIGIQVGILTGVALSLALLLYETTHPHVAVLGNFPESGEYRNIERYPEVNIEEGVLIIRYDASLYFANLSHFKESLDALIEERSDPIKLVVLNCESMNTLDASAADMLLHYSQSLQEQGTELYFTGLIGPIRDLLGKLGLVEAIGPDHFFLDIQSAIDYFWDAEDKKAQISNIRAKQYNVKKA